MARKMSLVVISIPCFAHTPTGTTKTAIAMKIRQQPHVALC